MAKPKPAWTLLSLLGLALALFAIATGCGSRHRSGRVAELVYMDGGRGTVENVWVRYNGSDSARIWQPGKGCKVDWPLLSPDGRMVALAIKGKGIALVRPGGTSCEIVGRPYRGSMLEGVWSPDGRFLLATRANEQLVLIDATKRTERTIAGGELSSFSFSPDGSRIVYSLRRKPKTVRFLEIGYDLFVTPTGGGTTKRLTNDGLSIKPVWGKPGIAYARIARRKNSTWPHYQLWLMKADGGATRRIDFGQPAEIPYFGLLPVAWSADGTRLLALMNESENSEPYAVDLRQKRVWNVAPGEYTGIVDISRDGKRVLLVRNGFDWTSPSQVEIAPIYGGEPQIIARNAALPSWNS